MAEPMIPRGETRATPNLLQHLHAAQEAQQAADRAIDTLRIVARVPHDEFTDGRLEVAVSWLAEVIDHEMGKVSTALEGLEDAMKADQAQGGAS